MFLPIYDCPQCGKVWRVRHDEEADGECDWMMVDVVRCDRCDRQVKPRFKDMEPCCRHVTDEELIAFEGA